MEIKNIKYIIVGFILLFASTLQAQRLEVRFNKEFSNDEILNKAMGAGASFILDGWNEHLDFQFNFDYAGYKSDMDYLGISNKFTKLKGGVSALYTHQIGKNFHIRVGGDISYNNLHKIVTNKADTTVITGISTTSHRAHMLGIGAVAQFQAQLGKIWRIGIGVTPTYLIPLQAQVSRPNVECDYTKGLFVLQLQIGLEIRLGNLNSESNQQ